MDRQLITGIVERSVKKYPDNTDKATEMAKRQIKELPEYEEFIEDLFHRNIRALVENHRGQHNHNVRVRNGFYGGPAKVKITEAVLDVHKGLFLYHLAGRTLGMLFGHELDDIANQEESRANTHGFHASLARKLRPLVPDNKRVQDVVSHKKLQQIWAEAGGAALPALAQAGD